MHYHICWLFHTQLCISAPAPFATTTVQEFVSCVEKVDVWMSSIRYDTRCYFNVRSKANMSQLILPHGTDN